MCTVIARHNIIKRQKWNVYTKKCTHLWSKNTRNLRFEIDSNIVLRPFPTYSVETAHSLYSKLGFVAWKWDRMYVTLAGGRVTSFARQQVPACSGVSPLPVCLWQLFPFCFPYSKTNLLNTKWERCYFFIQGGNLMCQSKNEVRLGVYVHAIRGIYTGVFVYNEKIAEFLQIFCRISEISM